VMTQTQALQLSTLLYEAFADLSDGADVASRLLALAELVEANEATPGGIGDLFAYVARTPGAARLRIVK
jgi:hypothetical protein